MSSTKIAFDANSSLEGLCCCLPSALLTVGCSQIVMSFGIIGFEADSLEICLLGFQPLSKPSAHPTQLIVGVGEMAPGFNTLQITLLSLVIVNRPFIDRARIWLYAGRPTLRSVSLQGFHFHISGATQTKIGFSQVVVGFCEC